MSSDKYYEQAADELRTGKVNKALFSKAFADSEGDENKAKALYIKYRTQRAKRKKLIAILSAPFWMYGVFIGFISLGKAYRYIMPESSAKTTSEHSIINIPHNTENEQTNQEAVDRFYNKYPDLIGYEDLVAEAAHSVSPKHVDGTYKTEHELANEVGAIAREIIRKKK